MSSRFRPLWASLGLMALLPLIIRPVPPETVEDHEVAELIARGEHEKAYALLQDLEGANLSQRQRLIIQKALCERALNKPEEAYANLHRLQLHPVLEEYRRYWMAVALEEMEEREGAISAYQDFLLSSQHRALLDSAYFRLAALYVRGRTYDEALQLYRQLLKRRPEMTPEVLHLLARTHDARNDPGAARNRRIQLMRRHPGHRLALDAMARLGDGGSPKDLYARAVVHLRHRHYRRAAGTLEKFLAAYPRHALAGEAHFLVGRSHMGTRQYAEAQKVFAMVYERYRRPSALYRLGSVQIRRDQESQAIRSFEKLVRLYPDHELADQALWQAAKAMERRNRFDRAIALYRKLAERYPESRYGEEAQWNIGFMHYCRKQYGEALEVFRGLSGTAREPHIVDQSLFWAGKASRQMQLEDQALAFFRSAARGFPRSYYSARARAQGYMDGSGSKLPVSEALRASRKETPAVAGVQCLQRADALRQLGLVRLAQSELHRAERLNRDNIAALRVVRDHYEDFGLLDRALALAMRIFVADASMSDLHHLYPNYYWEEVERAAQEAGIDPYLVLSVIRQESSFQEKAVSRAGAMGLMQIMPQTGRRLAQTMGLGALERGELFNPSLSIRMGSYFLGNQVRQFTEGPTQDLGFELGLIAYNAGPGVARKWLGRFPIEDADVFVERIPYKETRLYVKLVLKNYTIYKALANV